MVKIECSSYYWFKFIKWDNWYWTSKLKIFLTQPGRKHKYLGNICF
jgi:hypothetical protein